MPACPAYEALGRESVAPRGQVYNVRAVLERRLPLTETLAGDIYDCLACRACESVCPSGVPVGSIMEEVRGIITDRASESWLARALKRVILGRVFIEPRRLAVLVALLRFYQKSGLRRAVRASGILCLFPGDLESREAMLPAVPARTSHEPLASSLLPQGASRGRVGLFTGCIAPHFFPDVNRATARVLQRNGFEVVVPADQRCCGALHLHNGLPEIARRLARVNVASFGAAGVDSVVVNAAGCGAALAEYGELLSGSGEGRAFSERAVDVSAFLVRNGFEPPRGAVPVRIAYDAPCHLFHAQGVREEPRKLLESIPGVELVPFRDSERCCGSAGIYNVTHHEISMKILDEKMSHLRVARPDIIATGNPGCLLQLALGVRRAGLSAEVTHPVVLLDRAYRGGASS